jgi:hypothetical protein
MLPIIPPLLSHIPLSASFFLRSSNCPSGFRHSHLLVSPQRRKMVMPGTRASEPHPCHRVDDLDVHQSFDPAAVNYDDYGHGTHVAGIAPPAEHPSTINHLPTIPFRTLRKGTSTGISIVSRIPFGVADEI